MDYQRAIQKYWYPSVNIFCHSFYDAVSIYCAVSNGRMTDGEDMGGIWPNHGTNPTFARREESH
jgi:hypothetical protein